MINATRMGRPMAFVIGALVASTALAGEATLFANRDFQGPAMTVRGPSPNLGQIGVNDTASSIVVRAGVWEVCSKPYFEGHCAQLQPGEYSSFGTSINDRIASIREVTQPASGATTTATQPRIVASTDVVDHPSTTPLAQPAPPVTRPNAPAAATAVQPAYARVVLYELPNFGGHSIVIDRPVISQLTNQWFGNGAGSMRIEGGTWFFCSDSNFAGHCQTFGPGDYAHLPWTQERVASGYFVPSS